MTVTSMTGFARAQGQAEGCAWTWEVKSVNGKGLDVRCRYPGGFDAIDLPARERVAKRFKRGNVNLGLQIVWTTSQSRYQVNREVLDQVIAILPELKQKVPDAREPSLDGLLALRGVIEPIEEIQSEEDRAALEAALLAGLDTALDSLAGNRAAEGARMKDVVAGHIEVIEHLCEEAGGLAATQPDAIKARFEEQVAAVTEAVPALPEERLTQELALLATKADIREELDRLAAHIKAARDLLSRGGVIGRKFDFLCQEFNREANTLCSKSADKELTRVGLDLKAAIEQLREQIQNIE